MAWILEELAHLFGSAIFYYLGGTMKGPFERLKYDLRRLWECPSCNRRERSDGTVTTRFCICPGQGGPEGQRTAMKLLEEAGHRAVPKIIYRPNDDVAPAAAPDNVSIQPEVVAWSEPPADA
ncbi:MAG: hypothetical protein IAF94_18155 [Pirellulaceae bacterium]|nr:hypothetical protein [Pirellulaceae bacterium]